MNNGDWLKQATKKLEATGIGIARLDALVLLEDVTGNDRAWLLANPGYGLSAAEQGKLTKLLNQRAQHTPLAYVRGTTEFYGRNFVITAAVLEPRPESEAIIDLFKQLLVSEDFRSKTLKIADVGAGSGALGITAALESPKGQKIAVDLLEVDPKALKIAKINVDKYTTSVSVMQSDLLAQSKKDYDILLCNLPYVPDGHTVNEAALHEPRIAIFGGPDGLDLYRRLFDQVSSLAKRPLFILTESLPFQHVALETIARRGGYRVQQSEDFIQVFTKS